MTILSIESAAKTASVCILQGGTVLAEYTTNLKMTHSQTLLPMIKEILEMCDMKPADIDYIAVSTGPGSYTGLRIGVSTAKGLAMGASPDDPELKGIPCVAVSSLEAMAYNLSVVTDALICPVMDARRQRVYCGLYTFTQTKDDNGYSSSRAYSGDSDGNGRRIPETRVVMEDTVMECDELIRILSEKEKPVIFIGDGTEVLCKCENVGERPDIFRSAPPHLNTAKASGVAAAAMVRISRGEITDADSLLPEYLSESQAERERFREMTPEDVEAVAKIEEEAISPPWSEKAFYDALKNENAYFAVCESGGAVKGYAGMYMAADEAEITNVAVREDSRHGGVGQGLVGFLIKVGRTKGIHKIILEVRKGNVPAISLYEKCGFEKTGERKDFYSSPKEDAVIMCYDIETS